MDNSQFSHTVGPNQDVAYQRMSNHPWINKLIASGHAVNDDEEELDDLVEDICVPQHNPRGKAEMPDIEWCNFVPSALTIDWLLHRQRQRLPPGLCPSTLPSLLHAILTPSDAVFVGIEDEDKQRLFAHGSNARTGRITHLGNFPLVAIAPKCFAGAHS